MPARPDPKRICGRIGLALFAMLAVWNAGIFTLQWCVGRYAPWLLFSPWTLWLLNSVPLFLLGVPVFLLILRTLPDGPTILRWRLPFGAREYALAMLFCLGASRLINVAGTLVLMLFQGFWGSGEIVISPVQDILFAGGFLPSLVFGVIVPAVGEEYIFRYMIRRKMRGCPDSTYIFFSGLCFALLHGNITQGLFTFVVGAIFAWAYVMTGKFLVPVSMHFLLNFIGIVPAFAVGSRSMIVLLGLFSLGCIAGGVLVFFACRRSFLATLQPPAEAGWPYSANPPRNSGRTDSISRRSVFRIYF